MEEINSMHELSLEWGCVTNLMDRICSIESTIDGGWIELVDMVADAVTIEGAKKNPESVFFNLYSFLWRLYYRIKENPTAQPFNRYSYSEKNHWFMICNYDYKIFCWAIQNGFVDGISNNCITIPEEKLKENQIELLKRRCI